MLVVTGRDRRTAGAEVLGAVIRVAVFGTRSDVVGDEGFGADACGPTDKGLVVGACRSRKLGIAECDTGRAVDENRVQVDTDATADRAVDTLLDAAAAGAGVVAGVVYVASPP